MREVYTFQSVFHVTQGHEVLRCTVSFWATRKASAKVLQVYPPTHPKEFVLVAFLMVVIKHLTEAIKGRKGFFRLTV